MVFKTRFALPDIYIGSWVDYIIFTIKAPMIGWREAARGIKRFRRFVPIVETAPSAREYGRALRNAWLLVMASRVEGGASIEAYFQQLYTEVRRMMQRGGDILAQVFMLVVLVGVVLGIFSAVLPSMAGLNLLMLCVMGFLVMLMAPKAHYITITILDIIGTITAVASYALVGLVLGHPNLAVSVAFLAYGLMVLPNTIGDYKLRLSLRQRVMNSFNEITTRPVPTPLMDLSPIERALRPLWEEARGSGAPHLIAWSNALVLDFLGVVNNVLVNGLIYGLVVVGMGAGISIGLFAWVLGIIWKSAAYAAQAGISIPFIVGLGINNYYNAIGTGFLGGAMVFDYRLGALVGGLLGVVGWFLLSPYFVLP